MEPTEEITLKSGRVLQIFQDESPESPREWDNFGIMACFHNRYDLGDKKKGKSRRKGKFEFSDEDFESWAEMEGHIRNVEKAVVCLPLYLYDHSGITISTKPFSCKFDSGQVGFIYVTQKQLDEMGTSQGSGDGILEDESDEAFIQRLTEYLEEEVEQYDQYIRGEVYLFKLVEKDQDGEETEVDSCGGFFGDDVKTNGMLDHLGPDDQPIDEL